METKPRSVVVLPVLFEGQTKAVIELASIGTFTATHLAFLEQLTESIGIVLNTIEATMRTEGLLKQSQQLAGELQTRQTELQRTNEELAEKARQLADQNAEVERKNREIEHARLALWKKRRRSWRLTSKYKSEFLANMSHELRTPLNSILILGQQLSDNPSGNLTAKQVEFAKTIHSAGTDLAQPDQRHPRPVQDRIRNGHRRAGGSAAFTSIRDTVERNFRHVAETRNLGFAISLDPNLPRNLTTDTKRLLAGAEEPALECIQVHVARSRELSPSLWRERRLESGSSFARRERRRWSLSRDRHRDRHSARINSGSSSRRSSKPTPAPAASTAAPGWAWPSAASWPACLAAKFGSSASPGEGSTFRLYLPQSYTRTDLRDK